MKGGNPTLLKKGKLKTCTALHDRVFLVPVKCDLVVLIRFFVDCFSAKYGFIRLCKKSGRVDRYRSRYVEIIGERLIADLTFDKYTSIDLIVDLLSIFEIRIDKGV